MLFRALTREFVWLLSSSRRPDLPQMRQSAESRDRARHSRSTLSVFWPCHCWPLEVGLKLRNYRGRNWMWTRLAFFSSWSMKARPCS